MQLALLKCSGMIHVTSMLKSLLMTGLGRNERVKGAWVVFSVKGSATCCRGLNQNRQVLHCIWANMPDDVLQKEVPVEVFYGPLDPCS